MMKQWAKIAQVHENLNEKGEWLATPSKLDEPLLQIQEEVVSVGLGGTIVMSQTLHEREKLAEDRCMRPLVWLLKAD